MQVRSLEARLKTRLAVEVRERVEAQLTSARAQLDNVLNAQHAATDGATAAALAAAQPVSATSAR